MLKLGEKVIYESRDNFELGTFGKLPIGDKTIFITNLGNIIIEETTKIFKKEETKKYYYSYSKNKQRFDIKLENSTVVLQHNELPFTVGDGIIDNIYGEMDLDYDGYADISYESDILL